MSEFDEFDEAIDENIVDEIAPEEFIVSLVYRTHDLLIADYDALVTAYPNLASKEIIGVSVEGRQIPMYTFGKGEGKILLDSTMHGGEDIGGELFLMWFRDFLLPQNSPVLHGCTIKVVPVVNIDRTSRPNAHYVNLNRNFVRGWSSATQLPYCKAASPTHYSYNPMVGDPDHGYPPVWTAHGHTHNFLPFEVLPSTWTCPVCGAAKSTFSNPQNWRGPSAASEPETQALINVFKTWKPHIYCDTHHYDGPWMAGYFSTSDTVAKAKLTDIKNRIIALGQELGITPMPFNLNGGLGTGFATSDAYTEGALSTLIEWNLTTPPLTDLPTIHLPRWQLIGEAFAEAVAAGECYWDSQLNKWVCELPQPSQPPQNMLALLAILSLFLAVG